MLRLMEEIQNRIRAEKLLFSDNSEYTKEEVKFISNVCVDTIRQEPCYMSLFIEYLSKLRKLYKKYNGENFDKEIYDLGMEVGKWAAKPDLERDFDEQGAHLLYNNFLGLPKDETYYDFIKNRVMNVYQVREVLDEGYAYQFYSHNTNFLLTNNFLLIHYPELYNTDDLRQLKSIAYDADKTRFATEEDYKNFKRAANQTKIRIRRYEKNHNVKIKTK